jgi:nucleoside transporter
MLLRPRLSLMMFLQYFVWGAWFVTLSTYMATASNAEGGRLFSDELIGQAYGTAAIAAMIAPIFVGMIADRFFSTERVLAVLHVLGAALLFMLSRSHTSATLYVAALAYFMAYIPTLALTNSLSFHHLAEPSQEFPAIRVWGTIGWIVAGILVGSLRFADGLWNFVFDRPFGLPLNLTFGSTLEPAASIQLTSIPMLLAAAAELVLGVYCCTLPHTPPSNVGKAVGVRDVLGLDALALFKERSFAIFMFCSFLVCIPLQFYYTFTNQFLNELGIEGAAAKQTYGQMSEFVFMMLMPLFFARLGVKWMLLVGMAAWALRYVLFAFGNGGGEMWMLVVGILLHGVCYDFFFVTGQIYVDSKSPRDSRAAAQGMLAFVTLGLGLFFGSLISGKIVASLATSEGSIPHDWRSIWLAPAAMAAGVMVLFAIFFRDDIQEDDTRDAAGEDSSLSSQAPAT